MMRRVALRSVLSLIHHSVVSWRQQLVSASRLHLMLSLWLLKAITP